MNMGKFKIVKGEINQVHIDILGSDNRNRSELDTFSQKIIPFTALDMKDKEGIRKVRVRTVLG